MTRATDPKKRLAEKATENLRLRRQRRGLPTAYELKSSARNGTTIQDLAAARGYSLTALAGLLGVPYGTLGKWAALTRGVSRADAERLGFALGVPPEAINLRRRGWPVPEEDAPELTLDAALETDEPVAVLSEHPSKWRSA